MSNVNIEECKTCRFYPDNCHYHNNEGADISSLIANSDGTCQKRQPKEESRNVGQEIS